jgi:copper chaperone CopZ
LRWFTSSIRGVHGTQIEKRWERDYELSSIDHARRLLFCSRDRVGLAVTVSSDRRILERARHMETVKFVIPKLDGSAGVGDLATAILGISGVAGIATDLSSHTVTVEYDPHYVNPKLISGSIEGSGYPVDSLSNTAEMPQR